MIFKKILSIMALVFTATSLLAAYVPPIPAITNGTANVGLKTPFLVTNTSALAGDNNQGHQIFGLWDSVNSSGPLWLMNYYGGAPYWSADPEQYEDYIQPSFNSTVAAGGPVGNAGLATYWANVHLLSLGSDDRVFVGVDTAFGTNAEYGSSIELLARSSLHASSTIQTQNGIFAHPLKLWGDDRVQIGALPLSYHTKYYPSSAYLELWTDGDNTAPAFLFHDEVLATTPVNGALERNNGVLFWTDDSGGRYGILTSNTVSSAVIGRNGMINNTIQTNIISYGNTNVTLNNLTSPTFNNSEYGWYYPANAGGGGFAPLVTIDDDFRGGNDTNANHDGCVACWSYINDSSPMHNAGRFFGYSYPWYQTYGGDARALILKGEMAATANQWGGGAFILETRATSSGGSPGGHNGVFNNPFYVSTNGTMAFGNLTDSADQNNNAIKPTAWLQIAGDGSYWANHGTVGSWVSQSGGTASVLPPFSIMSQSLVGTPVASAHEYDGANWYFTDDSATRWVMIKGNSSFGVNVGNITTTNGIASKASTSVGFTTGGITNTTSYILRVLGFTGTGVTYSNITTKMNVSLGNLTTPSNFALQPNEMLYGSSCAESTNVSF